MGNPPTHAKGLHGAAIGLLAGVSAWSVDERCASVVDVTPRPLWWRTLARTPAALLLLAVWDAVHLIVRDQLPERLDVLVVQGLSAAIAGFAAATWQRARVHAEPGQRIALFVCPLAVAVALARPWNDQVPLFPIWPHENWPRAMAIWSIVGGAAVALMTTALRHDARSARTPLPWRG